MFDKDAVDFERFVKMLSIPQSAAFPAPDLSPICFIRSSFQEFCDMGRVSGVGCRVRRWMPRTLRRMADRLLCVAFQKSRVKKNEDSSVELSFLFIRCDEVL